MNQKKMKQTSKAIEEKIKEQIQNDLEEPDHENLHETTKGRFKKPAQENSMYKAQIILVNKDKKAQETVTYFVSANSTVYVSGLRFF